MKKLNVTKEAFEKSKYFQKKYGRLTHVSESGKIYKTSKGNLLRFVNESKSKESADFDIGERVKLDTYQASWEYGSGSEDWIDELPVSGWKIEDIKVDDDDEFVYVIRNNRVGETLEVSGFALKGA